MDNRFDTYLKALAAGYREGGTEHTGRTALENLLNAFKADAFQPRIQVQHEGGREGDKGAPDFKIKRDGMILGYVEVKTIGENLDKILRSDQIARYRKLSGNILVTDYLHFIRIDETGKVLGKRAELAYPSDLEGRTLRIAPEKAEAVTEVLKAFFSEAPQGLGRAQQLALALATRSKMLRDFLTEELIRQEKLNKEGRLHALFDVFREQVFHELSTKEFADAFAQMLAYGLFLAKLNVPEPKEGADPEVVALDNVRKFIPGSFRLIRELVRFLEEMQEAEYDEAKWIVDEILSIVNGLAIANIREDLSFRNRKAVNPKVRAGDEEEHRLFERDPFIYFYEDFLKAYDKDTRKGRGVYYTPPPVVNFIVRAVDDILKDTFKITDGLADHRQVTVLDFAAGTGTFLLEVMQKIFDNIGGPESGKAAAVVREHMAKNLYGFEYLIAPYTIAHLKLSQYLRDKGHPLAKDERLQVFLTNTLEPIEPQRSTFLPELSNEVEEAQKVKEKPILVILGNPPYSGHSKNKGAWISAAIDGYKYTVERVQTETDKDGNPVFSDVNKPLGERNPKWLNDDYVKFIRFAQLKMDAVEEGVVGIITNHSWLDNPTFRGMRQSLMRSFDQIHVLDLHGNFKKKEVAPDGSKDENVFDIEQGVAISIFVKRPNLEKGVWRGDIWGRRLEKYKVAAEGLLADLGLAPVSPVEPHYLFQAQDVDMREEYGRGVSISQIMPSSSVGIVTARDSLTIKFDPDAVRETIKDFAGLDIERAREKYNLGDDARDWRVEWAQADLKNSGLDAGLIQLIEYRPFDKRWTYYTGVSRGFHCNPRREIMSTFSTRSNIGISVCRFVNSEWSHILAVQNIVDDSFVSNKTKERGYIFPLYNLAGENLSSDFRSYVNARYDHHYSPEEILGYIYAVLHAPAYRSRFAEFLRIDFPRIPFAETNEHFEALSRLGWTLVQAHLMRGLPRRGLGDFHGRGGNEVEHVRWSAEDQRISINKVHIGGYQVIDKYLKSRKGRTLSLDEINHVARICDALAFTIDQMAAIDLAYAQAFPDRG
jgi:Type ISP C-terminal specificity domain/N-6 DNA Methylase